MFKALRLAVALLAVLSLPSSRNSRHRSSSTCVTGRARAWRPSTRASTINAGRLLQHVVRLHEPQLRGGARHSGRPEQHVRARRRSRAADAFRDPAAQGRLQRHRAEGLRQTRRWCGSSPRTARRDQVVATLKPVWQIDRLRTTRGGNSENVSSNLPPVVNVQIVTTQARRGSDDAERCRRPTTACRSGAAKPVGMTVLWAKYRGPGAVHVRGHRSRSSPTASASTIGDASASRASTSCRRSSTTAQASRPATSAITAAGPTRR